MTPQPEKRSDEKRRAFSNHTEFEMWEVNWCDRCLRDAPFRTMGKGSGCPILAVSMIDNVVPPEWIEQPFDHYPSDAYHCIEFRPPGWRDPEPKPQPDPQPDGLFPTPERATRMLTTAPVAAPETVSGASR